jgi:hypothetical protein
VDINNLAVKLILLFLPGIASWFILEKLIISRKRDFSYYVIYSFLLGFSSYFSYFGILSLINLLFEKSYKVNFFYLLLNSSELNSPAEIFREIFFVSILGFILALILSIVINKRWFHRILQELKITKRYSEPDLWSYLFNSENEYGVSVIDYQNNKIYKGKINSYSDTLGEVAELYLENVSVFDEKSGDYLYDVDKIYLSRESKNITIEYTDEYIIQGEN